MTGAYDMGEWDDDFSAAEEYVPVTIPEVDKEAERQFLQDPRFLAAAGAAGIIAAVVTGAVIRRKAKGRDVSTD
jgi:hypothetical protein